MQKKIAKILKDFRRFKIPCKCCVFNNLAIPLNLTRLPCLDYTIGMNSTSTSWHSHLDETKRGLARLLARENLIVRHADVPTANFDLQSRTLTLPKWTNITVDQYDLLIGHEVGHALYSDDLDAVKTSHQFPGLHTYINVLEDVRIERRIKDEFPGLRGSFTRGYRDFFNHGPIFQLEKPVEQYDFIDRINIHYKIGAHVDVPFSDDERLILARLDKCRTMQDVVALARELWNGQKKQNEEQQQQKQAGQIGQSSESSESSENTAPTAGQSEKSDDQQESNGSGDESEESDDEQSGNGSGEESDDEQPSGTVSGEQEPSTDEPEPSTDPVAETDQFNAEALSQLDRDQQTGNTIDQVMLSPLSATVVKSSTVDNGTFVRDALVHLSQNPTRLATATATLGTFQTKFGPTIAHMAREFDRRKTAKLHERARTARTGRIDLTKLASYKFREDIFQQVTIVPNGKSHGIVLLIDGSGSMQGVFGDVIEQVMLFTQFAQRVHIPVQAFMFHDGRSLAAQTLLEQMPAYTARPSGVELVCLYDSTQKNHKQQQIVLAAVAHMFNGDRYQSEIAVPHIHLGMTPLNGGLFLVERHVAALKQSLRLEKMSLIVLTDGDASDTVTYTTNGDRYSLNRAAIYRDTVTRQVYNCVEERKAWDGTSYFTQQSNSDGAMLVDSIRRRHGARVVRIHITDHPTSRRLREDSVSGVWTLVHSSLLPRIVEQGMTSLPSGMASKAASELRDKGQTTFASESLYYDALIVVTSNTLDLDDDDFESKDTTGWTARKIASSFTKANVNAMKNRVFVNSVVPYLA
jgi:uncharacterized protein with von Willebrand factor type A (vWA) domain